MAWAQPTVVTVQAQIEASGEVSVSGYSSRTGALPAPVLSAVLHCESRRRSDTDRFGDFRCISGARREGLSLEAVVDLAPIARMLLPADEINFWVQHPRVGFETSSMPMEDEGTEWRSARRVRLQAGAVPGPIRIQFGYRRDQLAAIYLPLAALALALTLIVIAFSRAGHAELTRSVFMLGTMFWLVAAAALQAGGPLRILLSGTGFANIAAAIIEYCPPLLCIAAGAALGQRKLTVFSEVFWSFGIFLFPLTCALGAVQSMGIGAWLDAAPWLAVAVIGVMICRWRMRSGGSVRVRQLTGGELQARVMELAAKTSRRDVHIYVSSSTRSQALNAFALLRNGIILTAPLISTLTRRELDAVVAHELSHFGQLRRSPWVALAVAAVLFQTPLTGLLFQGNGLFIAVLVPLTIFFASLRGVRKREFAADAGSAALTGDPQAMIGALVTISRKNERPLDCNRVVEWFSTHPSTEKRIRALGAAARLQEAEVEALRNGSYNSDPGVPYPLPPEEGAAIFSLAWQNANAKRYAWTALLGASGAGLFMALLLEKFGGSGFPQLLIGIALGCILTKVMAATMLASGYAWLRRRMAAKLEGHGQLIGLAVDSEPRVYHGYRFSDVGFLSFDGGRLCYQSERTTIRVNPADVVDVVMVAAAPSTWRRLQPMVRFRGGESADIHSVILHPVEWGASPQRLFRRIERWRAEAAPAESTSISGLNATAGQPFHVPTIAQTARGFRIPGTVTLLGVVFSGWFMRAESWPAWYALVITACAYTFMYLPAMLYRPASLPPALTPRVGAD